MVSANQDFSNNYIAYFDRIDSNLFRVRKPSEGSARKNGFSIGIDCPYQSARSRSVRSLLLVDLSYAVPWQMAETILPLCQN